MLLRMRWRIKSAKTGRCKGGNKDRYCLLFAGSIGNPKREQRSLESGLSGRALNGGKRRSDKSGGCLSVASSAGQAKAFAEVARTVQP